jgi:hypothetical protein
MLLFTNNKNPMIKYATPKASIGRALGSSFTVNTGKACKMDVMIKSVAAKLRMCFMF